MVKLRSIGMQVGSIAPNFQWTDGLVMWKEAFPQNEEMTKENLEGRIHWLWLAFAEMPEYKTEPHVQGDEHHDPGDERFRQPGLHRRGEVAEGTEMMVAWSPP